MSILKKIFKQTFWQILGKVITSLSTFIILGMVARNYQEAGTGTFTLVLTYLTMFFLINDFGFNAHILKQVTSDKRQVTSIWRRLLGIRLVYSVVLILLSVSLLPFLPFNSPEFNTAVIYGALAILGSAVFISGSLIFQSNLRYDLSVLPSSIGVFVYLILILILTQNKASLPTLTLAFMLGWIVMGLTSLLLVYPFVKNIWPIFDFSFVKNLIKDCWPVAVTLVLNVVYFRADAFLIAFFRNQSEVGIYNMAYQVFQSVLVLPSFIMNSYYPLMLKSLNGIRIVGLSILGIASLSTLVTLFLAPFLINILTGGGFLGSAQSLQILSLGFPAYFLSSLLMWFFITKGQYKKMLLLYTSGLGINLLLNFIFIPQYSFYAASWITVISEYTILLMQIIVLRGILFRWF